MCGRCQGRAFLAFVVGVGWYLWSEYKRVTGPEFREQLAQFGGEAVTKNQKEINGAAEKLAADLQPLASDILHQQWAKDQPAFTAALEKEGVEFQKSFQAQVKARLEAHYAKAMDEVKDSLKAEVPELAKDDAKLKRVQDAMVEATRRMVEERGAKRLDKGFGLVDSGWTRLPAAPAAHAGELSTAWKVVGHAVEIFYQVGTQPDALNKITDAATAAPLLRPTAPPAAPKAAPKEAPKADAKK